VTLSAEHPFAPKRRRTVATGGVRRSRTEPVVFGDKSQTAPKMLPNGTPRGVWMAAGALHPWLHSSVLPSLGKNWLSTPFPVLGTRPQGDFFPSSPGPSQRRLNCHGPGSRGASHPACYTLLKPRTSKLRSCLASLAHTTLFDFASFGRMHPIVPHRKPMDLHGGSPMVYRTLGRTPHRSLGGSDANRN